MHGDSIIRCAASLIVCSRISPLTPGQLRVSSDVPSSPLAEAASASALGQQRPRSTESAALNVVKKPRAEAGGSAGRQSKTAPVIRIDSPEVAKPVGPQSKVSEAVGCAPLSLCVARAWGSACARGAWRVVVCVVRYPEDTQGDGSSPSISHSHFLFCSFHSLQTQSLNTRRRCARFFNAWRDELANFMRKLRVLLLAAFAR